MLIQKTKRQGIFFQQLIEYLCSFANVTHEKIADSNLHVLRYKKQTLYLEDDEIPAICTGDKHISLDYWLLKRLWQSNKLPVHAGRIFGENEQQQCLEYVNSQLQWPISLYPAQKFTAATAVQGIATEQDFHLHWLNDMDFTQQRKVVVQECWLQSAHYQLLQFASGERGLLEQQGGESVAKPVETLKEKYWAVVEKQWQIFPRMPFICLDIEIRGDQFVLSDFHTNPNYEHYSLDCLPIVARRIFPEIFKENA